MSEAEHLLDAVQVHWAADDWQAVLDATGQPPAHGVQQGAASASAEAEVVAARCAALLQLGDRAEARTQARLALEAGAGRAALARVLLASARRALGRARLAVGPGEAASQHLARSHLRGTYLAAETKRNTAQVEQRLQSALDARKEAVLKERRSAVLQIDSAAGWPAELVARCLAAPDLHEAVDHLLDKVLTASDDRVRLMMALAEHFRSVPDRMTAVHFLNTASLFVQGAQPTLRLELARLLAAAGQQALAMDLVFDAAIANTESTPGALELGRTVRRTYRALRESEQAAREHGHELLLAHLKSRFPKQGDATGRSLVEIGTTREDVPGQGSTRRLAEFCQFHGMVFTTVDMDPHNSRSAERLFKMRGMPFQAVTMKGEDYLRQRTEPLDFVFLDAYDFDHGQHSELRQSRYLKFLGSRIDTQACHEMHLDCARSMLRLLTPDGAVCVDDTWTEEGKWTAKGTLAMPFLLEHGFEVVDARNSAALLKRGAA